MSHVPQHNRPIFSTPVLWAIRVLSWLALGVTAYLAWHAVNQTSVAGCGVGDQTGCDVVLSSSWSKWLGLPVAIGGLACYAALAGLSVLLGWQNPRASRWIGALAVMLSTVAAGASIWFVFLQLFAIQDICRFCMVADLCGIAIGALALWATARRMYLNHTLRNTTTGLMALRIALPTTVHISSAPLHDPDGRPPFGLALSGAIVLLLALIGGQIFFPAKTFSVQEVALTESIEMVGSNEPDARGASESSRPQPHVAMRIPSEPDGNDKQAAADDETEPSPAASEVAASTADIAASTPDIESAAAEPPPSNPSDRPPAAAAKPRQRLVKFLDGNLTLDVYRHPLIGSRDAPHVMVEIVSYDCLHCRKMHRVVDEGLRRYGDQIAIILLVIPMEKGCNKLITDPKASHRGACSTARMALGVATLKPELFPKFHDWLMAGKDQPPVLEKIVAKAYSMVDRDRLRELTRGEVLNKQVAGYVNLFGKLRAQAGEKSGFGLPIQILGDKIMTGSVDDADDVYRAWEEHLGVQPRGS